MKPGKVTVAHRYKVKGGIYIGRPSVLGNPFKIHASATREDVIRHFDKWLRGDYRPFLEIKRKEALKEIRSLRHRVKAGEDIVLVCWCFPKSCHGDIIKRRIEK